MPKARVLVSINTSWNIYNFRSGLVRALVEHGYEVISAAPRDEYSDRLQEIGSRYVELPMDNKGTSPFRDSALFARFVSLFCHEQPDIFLGYTIKPNIYGSSAAHAFGIPVINNVSGLGTAFIKNTWLTGLVKGLYRIALHRSERVFFQNDEDRTYFVGQKLVRPEKAGLVPGSGVDLSRFKPDIAPRTNLDGWFRFLLAGRLLWDKGIGEFVEAARIVRREHPDAHFQILGFLDAENQTAIPRNTVDAWVAEGVIDYLGATDDVPPFIGAADCVVLPSYREGTPRSLLEAAAMAKPLIATDVPGCRQVVNHGVNGLLCRVCDASDLAKAMSEMIRMPPEQRVALGVASRAKVEREFDERIVFQRYLGEIEESLSGTRRRYHRPARIS